ncbi:hypothetical protein D8B26_007052 [Coccidioides posadasii str. Silveira]|uniref:N-acetyltransferase domain-containing protein n=2 Tax=Coccidioides posadasii TaxID=199306 RepID=E9DH10_COCPS|nr:conserved hypothetical protein [Coccidioides posadasii str. Silveira]QVM12423.1 hypothetical protein D8B26_007052 [Coccidioides posadasii str. Silveira]
MTERQQLCVSKETPSPSGEPSNSSLSSAASAHSGVKFILEPSIAIIENSSGVSKQNSVRMATQLYESFTADQITDAMLDEAAKLFSENYGIWGKQSRCPGKPVKLSGHRLREQNLPEASASLHVRVTVDGNLAGSAFACRWKHDGKNVCWITQLVVDRDYRERGLAGGLLRSIRSDGDDIYGIMSSHPAACLAAASAFGTSIERVSLNFIAENAEAIMKVSPISYVREAKLCGSLFEPEDPTGLICGVNTGFFVDHEEPLEALKMVKETWVWPFGDLLDGHEYLLVLPAKHRRSRSRSSKPKRDMPS